MNEWLKISESVILEYKWWEMINLSPGSHASPTFGFGALALAQ